MVRVKRWVEVITIKKIKWYFQSSFLFKFDFFQSILILTSYQSFMLYFILIYFHNNINKLSKYNDHFIMRCYLYIYYCCWVFIRNIGTPVRKVSVVYCNYYYYDLIHITDFILITFYCVSMLKFIYIKKLRIITEQALFGIPSVST